MDYYDNGNKGPSPRTYWTEGVLIPAQWAIISPDSWGKYYGSSSFYFRTM